MNNCLQQAQVQDSLKSQGFPEYQETTFSAKSGCEQIVVETGSALEVNFQLSLTPFLSIA